MALLNDLTLGQIFTRLLAFLVIIGVHGFLLAGLARLLGDPTPQYTERLTPNPVSHLMVSALAMAVLFEMFWIKPMKIRVENLRFGRWGLVLIAVGALALTLALVPLINLIRPVVPVLLPRSAALVALSVLIQIQDLAIWFVALNWLPLPFFTGQLLAFAAWPKAEALSYRYRNIAIVLIGAAMVAGFAGPVIGYMHDGLEAVLLR